MARWLTDDEMAKLHNGLLPVLKANPMNQPLDDDEMKLCIGWAADQDTAGELIMSHPDILQSFMLPGLERVARLAGAAKHALAIGDANGAYLPFYRRPHPGTHFCIEVYVPVYDAFGDDVKLLH